MTFIVFDPDNYTPDELQKVLNTLSTDSIFLDIADPQKLQKILSDNGIKTKYRNEYPADKFGSLGRWVFEKE